MNKVVNTYWADNRLAAQSVAPRTAGQTFGQNISQTAAESKRGKLIPRWLIFAVIAFLSFLFCLTINVRTHSKMVNEIDEQAVLNGQLKQIEADNQGLREEVSRLQNDPQTIERAARIRLNMVRPNEKIVISD